jgi:hypothetical protein
LKMNQTPADVDMESDETIDVKIKWGKLKHCVIIALYRLGVGIANMMWIIDGRHPNAMPIS